MKKDIGLFFLLSAIVAGCLTGCAALNDERDRPFGVNFPAESLSDRAVVVFFVDGVNAEIFEQMLRAKKLPNIKRYFLDRGTYIPRCTANIPSVTLANETSTVTGLFPGHHGVTGINWFDRVKLIWRNYETIDQKNLLDNDYRATTIFETLGDATTVSIFYQAHRGATKFVENRLSAGPPFFFRWYELVDRISLCRFDLVARIAATRGRFPLFTIAYMLAVDFRGYDQGLDSPEYRQALIHTDAHIGRVLADFEAAGMLDKLVIVLTADHGLTRVRHHLALDDFLRNRLGLSLAKKRLWEAMPFENRLDYYRQFTAVTAGSGDRYWAVYLRKPKVGGGFDAWPIRPAPEDLRRYSTRNGNRIDLIARLIDQDAVDAVAWRKGPKTVRLVRRTGTVELKRTGPGQFSYRVISGRDPLGYAATGVPAEMLSGRPAPSRRWLDATAKTQFPDLVPQLVAYFQAPRRGDLAVFAAPGWDFNTINQAGHGGLRPAEMHFPLLLAGPGVPHTILPTARAVDLVPTLLHLLGRPIPKERDGTTLFKTRK